MASGAYVRSVEATGQNHKLCGGKMSVFEIHTRVDDQIFEQFKKIVNTRPVKNKHILCHIEEAMKIWIENQQKTQ